MPGHVEAQYGRAIGRRGKANPYNPRDAIFAAARLLAANGGMHHIHAAIFAYNHATWYVNEVMWRAQLISAWSSNGQRPERRRLRAAVEREVHAHAGANR